MGKNLIIAIVAGLLVIGGGAGYILTKQDGSDKTTNNNSNMATENNGSAEFNPVNSMTKDFVATIKTEGEGEGAVVNVSVDFDADQKAWHMTSTSDETQTSESIITESAYYAKFDDKWTKLPYSPGADSGFDEGAYTVTDKELKDFQSVLKYKGEAGCPAGTCELWEAENYQGNDKLSFYVEKSNNTINQLITKTGAATNTIIYTYKDVMVEIPADAQEIPAL